MWMAYFEDSERMLQCYKEVSKTKKQTTGLKLDPKDMVSHQSGAMSPDARQVRVTETCMVLDAAL
ncbi:predicted protein [Sclerotinia sclerotiorum 1980 UF-70]|uniref:Uncharacterized protein n=1 Tax=Sclerotinia sclerotiorum (strain ATCC 18683 / 1980 / Ss-1) TaxID=665079 RepID=A7F933_SCLS1|nr:predicted protein [Sclerotinia sclerotiorum 1980 UF-70]EDN99254.1 predicted protein [Sclerotinia sclerotiorum 1980 UF-70]